MRGVAGAALCVAAALAAAGAPRAGAQEPAGELRADRERARPRLDRQALERRADDTLDLGLEVLRSLPHGNAVVSPQAIAHTLALAYAGAGGATATELARALRLGGGQGGGLEALNALDQELAARTGTGRAGTFRLQVRSSVWLQRGRAVRPEYLDALATHFGVGVGRADFAGDLGGARAAINRWAAAAAGDGLDDLGRTGVNGALRLALIGVAALDAAWQTPFEPGRTTQGNFVSEGAGILAVPLMSVTARMTVVTTEGLRAVDVPLARDDLRLMIVMAEQGEIGELARSLTADRLARVAATLRQPAREVSLSLPRVAVETRVDLREALTSAGVRDLFSARADLTGIDPAGGLRAAAALHHVRVDLGEAGVGGAGALALGARPAALLLPAPRQQPPAGFAVDRPFLFLVRDRATGAVLFLGRVVDPR